MNQYFERLLNVLSHSISQINDDSFHQLVSDSVHTLQIGKKIVVSGLGKNVAICDKFVGSMVSLGLNACFLHTNSAIHGDMGVVKDGDLVIILTKSGETSESIYLTKLLRQRNVNLWLLTFETDSKLAKEIDNKLIVRMEHEGDLWNIMPNNSSTLNLIILQALVMQVAERLNLQLDDFKRNHPGGHIGEVLKHE